MAERNTKTRLELTWIGKENRPRLEPRGLLEDPAKSYHAARRVSDHDLFDNRLIFGDNLLALKALDIRASGDTILTSRPSFSGAPAARYGARPAAAAAVVSPRSRLFDVSVFCRTAPSGPALPREGTASKT